MKFRLTYEGLLPSTQNRPEHKQKDPRSNIKHEIRKHFHPQMLRLWEVNRNLSSPRPSEDVLTVSSDGPPSPAKLAKKFAMFGWNFVPLVTEESGLSCSLDILLLRPTPKHKNSWHGDIDNRIKTLLDALQIPNAHENYAERQVADNEKPFYCLLENDKYLTHLAVETDEMLEPVGEEVKDDHLRLIITVEVRPLIVSMDNLAFA